VSNLPQLQAEGRVGSDGRVAEAVEVDREPNLPAPVKAAPKSMVRAAVGCGRQCSACGCTADQCMCACAQVAVERVDVDVEVDESLYERDEATGVAREWLCGVWLCCVCSCSCMRPRGGGVRSAVPGAALHHAIRSLVGVGLLVQRAVRQQQAQVGRADQAAGCACEDWLLRASVASGGGAGVAAGSLVCTHGPAAQPLCEQRGSSGGAGPRGR